MDAMPPPSPAPEPAFPHPSQPPAMPMPAVVTVFGIMHLVLAVIGVGMVAFSKLMEGFSKGMMAAQSGQPGFAGAQARMQQQLLEATEKVNWFSYIGMGVLAVLLAISGVLLLRRRVAGIKVSNIYACLSILLKAATMVVFFAWTLPQIEPVMAELSKSGGPEAQMLGNVMRGSMILSGVLSPVMMCVYPVLALALLNRPKIKQAFAAAR